MPYTNPDTMTEVANILEDFNEETLREIFKTQIIQEDSYINIPTDHFMPLYHAFSRAKDIDSIDPDDIDRIQREYYGICQSIIGYICVKFGVEVDDEWTSTHVGKVPALTLSMYQFFVLDFFYIILSVLNNYIATNIDDLFNAFSDAVQNKDASTITHMKSMDPKYAAIAASLYDVTDYAFTMMDSETFFEYLHPSYLNGSILKKMTEDGVLTGDFVRKFADIYKENLALRSKITFELYLKIKETGSLPVNQLVITNDTLVAQAIEREEAARKLQEATPATESFATIDSDVDSE